MADFLVACVKHGSPNVGAAFCEHLVLKIEMVHQCNHPVQQPQEIPNSYYPPGGTAYYFSETGKQVCVSVSLCVCLCQCSTLENCHLLTKMYIFKVYL